MTQRKSQWIISHDWEFKQGGTVGKQTTLKAALAQHYHDTPRDETPTLADIIDALTDLRHLCTAEQIDFDECDAQAAAHFASETGGTQT